MTGQETDDDVMDDQKYVSTSIISLAQTDRS
jgi:hypothetical protein